MGFATVGHGDRPGAQQPRLSLVHVLDSEAAHLGGHLVQNGAHILGIGSRVLKRILALRQGRPGGAGEVVATAKHNFIRSLLDHHHAGIDGGIHRQAGIVKRAFRQLLVGAAYLFQPFAEALGLFVTAEEYALAHDGNQLAAWLQQIIGVLDVLHVAAITERRIHNDPVVLAGHLHEIVTDYVKALGL